MSIHQITKVWDHEMEPNEQLVLISMADHANEDGSGVWPSNDLLARKTGYSVRTIQRVKKSLIEKGFLEVVEENRGAQPNEYHIRWPERHRKEETEEGDGQNEQVGGQSCGVTAASSNGDSDDTQTVKKQGSTNVEQAELGSGYSPPSFGSTSPVDAAAQSDSHHEAWTTLDALDETEEKNQFLSVLFAKMFMPSDMDRFTDGNVHGRLIGMKNRAKQFADDPYLWLLRQFFRIKKSEDWSAPTARAKQALPTRILNYLSCVVSEQSDSVPEPEPGDKLTPNEVDLVTEHHDEYTSSDFDAFKNVDAIDPDEKAYIYKP